MLWECWWQLLDRVLWNIDGSSVVERRWTPVRPESRAGSTDEDRRPTFVSAPFVWFLDTESAINLFLDQN